MSESISERLLCAIAAQLSKVRTADGYRTDAGDRVYRCRRNLTDADLPCFVLWSPSETTTEDGSRYIKVEQQILVIGYAAAEKDDTGSIVEGLKSDVKRALAAERMRDELGSLGALRYVGAEMQPRPDGAVHESIVATFVAMRVEHRGDPNAIRT